MISVYFIILVFLMFPMFVVYDNKERVRFLMCGLLYYLVDVIKKYFDKKEKKVKIMNKQEVIEKIKNMATLKIRDTTVHQQFDTIDKHKALDIISQINESQKVVVPQFVADWLEVCKENLGFGLSTAMSHSTSAMKAQPNKVQGWFNLRDNQETFAKAWLYGYEVEKEKLYTVEIPNPNGGERPILFKNRDGKVSVVFASNPCWRTVKGAQLTEAEIKEYFGWAFRWAKEVKE